MDPRYNNAPHSNYGGNFQEMPNYGYAQPQYGQEYRGPPNHPQTPFYPNTLGSNSLNFMQNSAFQDVAMQYGSAVLGQGAGYVKQNVNQYVSLPRLKYYFAVNNAYVAKKTGLILFPFMHTKWGTISGSNEPVAPGDDLNAPDLYIPFMAFITYLLLTGVVYGFQGRFSPEYLGIQSSETFGWILLEVLVSLFFIYILNIKSNVSVLDIIAYAGYKFVSTTVILISYVFLDKPGYYFSLVYVSAALGFFMIRTLKAKILSCADSYSNECNKRRIYLLLMMALIQPVIMWWLTHRIMFSPA